MKTDAQTGNRIVDICGTVPRELDERLAEKIGYAFALWLSDKLEKETGDIVVAVGRDHRKSGISLLKSVIHGLTSADCDVLDAEETTSGALFMCLRSEENRADGCIMVTGGSLDDSMNGLRFMYEGGLLTPKDSEEILSQARELNVPMRLVSSIDAWQDYSMSLTTMVKDKLDADVQCPLLGLRTVCGYPARSGENFAAWLRELGAEVSVLDIDDENDPFCDAVKKALKNEAREFSADIAFAFSSDARSVLILDETGRELTGNRLIAVVAAALLDREPGLTVITDSVTSSGLQTFITEWGGIHYRFKRGYLNVINEAIRLNEEGIYCPVAIETSGHCAFKDNGFNDDGMYLAAVLTAAAMAMKREGQGLTKLLEGLIEPVESEELRLRILTDDVAAAAQEVIERILSYTLSDPGWKLAQDNREGVRITFDLDGGIDNAWLMMRLSLHDPVMPLNCESAVEGGNKRILSALYGLLKDEERVDLTPLRKAAGIHD